MAQNNTGIPYYTPAPKSSTIAATENNFSFEMLALNQTDDVAYSNTISYWITNNQTIPQTGFKNKLDWYQFLLRNTGLSKDTTPRGVIGTQDISAIKKVSQIALANRVPFEAMLTTLYSNKSQGEVKFSKNISTAIRLIDKGDAKSLLSNNYYQAFGSFPDQNLVNKFMDDYNAEATKQESKSTTTSSTTGGVTRSKTLTGNEGFTDKEQQQFLANYLVKNHNMTSSAELGGTAKSVYDQVISTSKNNFLDEPDFKEVSGLIAKIIGAGDDKVSNQMLTDYQNQQRRVASKQYLGIQAELLAGEDASTYTKPIYNFLVKTSGRNVSADDKFIKNALNFKDEKGNYRMMNEYEMKQAWLSDPRSATSPDAINQATSVGDLVRRKLGR